MSCPYHSDGVSIFIILTWYQYPTLTHQPAGVFTGATGLLVKADKIRHSGLSNQWRKNVCKRSSFHHYDIILVEDIMSNYMLALSVSFFQGSS
jgi:hypothetical protein